MALLDLVLPTPMAPGQRPSLHGELQFKASKWFLSFSFFFLVFDSNTQLSQLGGFVQQEQQVNGKQRAVQQVKAGWWQGGSVH